MAKTLKTVLVGCGGMGTGQAKILSGLPQFKLVAVSDVNAESAERCAKATGSKQYADLGIALSEEKPDVVAICTGNTTHAPLTIQAAEAGVRGIYCEKPMAANMADARRMVAACHVAGAALVVNHQRRLGPDLHAMRQVMDAGAIGEIKLIRGRCAGDVLSDGTHLVDSIMHLAHDAEVEWVLGQVHRDLVGLAAKGDRLGYAPDAPGFRYGHPIESGAFGVFQFKSSLRAEILCGDIVEPRRTYQDYEVYGTEGRLWRTGDGSTPNLFIQDKDGGSWKAGIDDWMYKPVPCEDGERGDWRAVEVGAPLEGGAIAEGYRILAHTIFEAGAHPMSGEKAILGFEVIMAVYESARLNKRIALPLEQDCFPLEIMLRESRL